jgi:hypothetical protein
MFNAITIPDHEVEPLVARITTFACEEVSKFLPSSEAFEGFQEDLVAVLFPIVQGYSTSAVQAEADAN